MRSKCKVCVVWDECVGRRCRKKIREIRNSLEDTVPDYFYEEVPRNGTAMKILNTSRACRNTEFQSHWALRDYLKTSNMHEEQNPEPFTCYIDEDFQDH